ncbi:heme lyase CcmF/NrfE family subunit [Yersinia massiliensis]|uniref:C-type cytochrome biogenesis protein CcmF n=1 Tax=Yersinia massiliensis TaxID=419257 RepID=A0ABM6UUI6_9GAMM|nr:heme lyase CcmF/NrfE family subunit [Yersinia massiliensis]AVX38637.1 c-type cytochrome biogenesis protein CcmF [Yersinia massiliensis]QKJ13358.1 heme lyase CcmF/NrfE family subunit [Yersinia massiliensis]
MIGELGLLSLLAAASLALLLSCVPFIALHGRRLPLLYWLPSFSYGVTLFLAVALFLLGWCFVTDDFSLLYVAQHANSQLPLFYKIAAIWGGHEGSMLFLLFALSLWSAALTAFRHHLPLRFFARAQGVLGGLLVILSLFILFFSNPFERLFPTLAEGRDLNPMLQDLALIFHPPLLYLGYSGFAISFAFAIAALLEGQTGQSMARYSRPWVLAAWCLLTMGILLGAWWAYSELGWGGWWFWDPVENASLLPWLTATALLHVLAISQRRGLYHHWGILLGLVTFQLCLLGTFIVRSGVLTSVHAFAVDTARGEALLAMFGIVTLASLTLFSLRVRGNRRAADFSVFSLETLLLAALVLLTVAAVTVLIGTLYPLIFSVLGLGSLSVGAPYFNQTLTPFVLLLLLLMGIMPFAQWRQSPKTALWRLAIPALLAVIGGVLSSGLGALWQVGMIPGVTLALWALLAPLFAPTIRCRSWLLHGGVAVSLLGMLFASYHSVEQGSRMSPGEQITLAGYQFTYRQTERQVGPNYTSERAHILVSRQGQPITLLLPERRRYTVRETLMIEPAIASGPLADFYAVLGDNLGSGEYSVRLYHKPLVSWIWGGALMMVLGGVLALWHRLKQGDDHLGEDR